MSIDCKQSKWRYMFQVWLALAVLLAALFLYLRGLKVHAGALHSLAVLFLVAIALAGAVAVGLLIYALFRRWCDLRGAPPKGRGTRGPGPASVQLPPALYKRPDPLIYSQDFLMARGLAVTWDNPDIWLTELPKPDGTLVPVGSHELLPHHTYRIFARFYNGSLEAPAVQMPVEFHFLSFGIGTTSNPIGTTRVDLPVRGAVGHPCVATVDWLTPPAPGHYCIRAQAIWDDDAEPGNNLGQKNVDVKKLNSPKATFKFALRNDAAADRRFRLESDVYGPPKPPSCEERARRDLLARHNLLTRIDPRSDPLAAHRRGAHPLPATWSIEFKGGTEHVLRPGEQIEVAATVMVPDTLVDPRPINVNAFADGLLAGGVTLYVHS